MVVVAVCGPAGVGKTTVATALRERLTDRGRSFELLHSDDFARDTYRRMYERVAGSEADWIVDGTFYERDWQTLFQRLDDEVLFVYLRAALESCLERNRERDDPIDERGVRGVFHEFDPPRAGVSVDTTGRSVAETVDQVTEAVLSRLDG
jgi:adenylylsulfate kinase